MAINLPNEVFIFIEGETPGKKDNPDDFALSQPNSQVQPTPQGHWISGTPGKWRIQEKTLLACGVGNCPLLKQRIIAP